ncbi:MAG: hypothetical protein ACNI27_05605 [Desulfovibrio sp.]
MQLSSKKYGTVPPCLIDLDGERVIVAKGNIAPAKRLTGTEPYLRYFVDFPESGNVGIEEISGVPKYAKRMLAKHLEDEGELYDDMDVLLYSSKKTGQTTTRVSYQIVPKKQYRMVLNEYANSKKGFLLHDGYSLLIGLLSTLKKGRDHVLALRTTDSVLVVAGDSKEAIFMQRYHLADDSNESVAAVIQSITTDLMDFNDEGRFFEEILWHEAMTQTIPEFPTGSSFAIKMNMVSVFSKSGERFYSSIPNLNKKVGTKCALGPDKEVLYMVLEQLEYVLWALCVVVLGVSLFRYSLFQKDISALQPEKNILVQSINNNKGKIANLKKRLPVLANVKESLKLAPKIKSIGTAPVLNHLWNKLANAVPLQCVVNTTDMQYLDKKIEIQVSGNVNAAMLEANDVFSGFMVSLERNGFTISDYQFDLRMGDNAFALKLEAPYEGGM